MTGWRRDAARDRLQRAHLGGGVEAVAALDLGRGRALEQHLVEAAAEAGGEILDRRPPRRLHRADDAAARVRDLRGSCGRPGAGGSPRRGRRRRPGACGASTKPGSTAPPPASTVRRGGAGGEIRGRAREGDPALRHRHRRVLDDPQVGQRGADPRRGAGEGGQAADVAHDQVWRRSSRGLPAPDVRRARASALAVEAARRAEACPRAGRPAAHLDRRGRHPQDARQQARERRVGVAVRPAPR